MRAAKKLENRFQRALNLMKSAENHGDVEKLSSELSTLQAAVLEKDQRIVTLTSDVENLTRKLATAEAEIKTQNDRLANQNKEGVSDKSEAHASLQKEFDALQAQRQADVAQMNEILEKLKPFVKD